MKWLTIKEAVDLLNTEHGDNKVTYDSMQKKVKRGTCEYQVAEIDGATMVGIPEEDDDPTRFYKIPTTIKVTTRYLVTYAQNSTEIDEQALACMESYCAAMGAKLIVVPGLYRNPTSPQESHKAKADNYWDPRIMPYLFRGSIDVGEALQIRADISISPTATTPTSGMHALTNNRSIVVGHPRVEMVSIPTVKIGTSVTISTTGAITVPHYSESKAGKKAEPYHTLGGLVIELSGNGRMFHQRHVKVINGRMYDLDKVFYADGSVEIEPIAALTPGDIHVHKIDQIVKNATFTGDDSIVYALRPAKIFLHDLFDHDTRNHHRINSFSDRFLRRVGRRTDSVVEELDEVATFLEELKEASPCSEIYIVPSNHDSALDRWLDSADWRADPINAELLLSLNLDKVRRLRKQGTCPSALSRYIHMSKIDTTNIKFLGANAHAVFDGICYHFHGHRGVNGARGSIAGFMKTGAPTNIGHSHTPGIRGHVYQCGVTGSLNQGYNVGAPSGWMNTHIITYNNGARTLVSVINGEWHG